MLASGEIPSRTRAVGAMPPTRGGRVGGRRRSIARGAIRRRDELRDDIDHFHLPPPRRAAIRRGRSGTTSTCCRPIGKRWAFISFIVGGAVPDGQWGGQVLVTLHEQGGASRRFVASVPVERRALLDARAPI